MTIDEIKSAIKDDFNLPEDLKIIAKEDLNKWVTKLGELYLLSPTLEMYSVGLPLKHPATSEYIEITNIFRFHTILGVKLYSKKYGDNYIVYCNTLGYKFKEVVSTEMYNQVYKSLTTTLSEYDIFHPYSH